MIITFKAEQTFSADLPSNSKLVMVRGGFVTWYTKNRDGLYDVSTCPIDSFECQNDTTSIELHRDEILALVKMVKGDKP
jgi:hypothetical protein